VIRCQECEKLFNTDKAIRKESIAFCSDRCAAAWQNLAALRLDELTDEHAQQFAAEYGKLSPSGINRGLRTLRRALNLAFRWNQLDKPVRVALAKGEHQRDRVLTDEELTAYLAACPQPWQDCATIIADEGMRPGEVFTLQWQHVPLNGSGGLIQVTNGKSKAARRVLPMTPRVYELLTARYEAAGRPAESWIFPHPSREGHFDGDAAKSRHDRALKTSGVKRFEPYVLRHTALTNLAAKGADAYTLARIAGHSSIVITMRYVHPQADAIERAFAMAHGKALGTEDSQVGTKLGTVQKSEEVPLLKARD
jgi:integrase